jgi:hypothetical protein
MPYKPGLGQGHNQKKDTHTLDFDVTLPHAPPDIANYLLLSVVAIIEHLSHTARSENLLLQL